MPHSPANKTMDRDDLHLPEAQTIVAELDELIRDLDRRGLRISAWYGRFELPDDPMSEERLNRGLAYEPWPGAADDGRFPWFLYWEIAWVCMNTDFKPGDKLLDLGGSSSLFACYLASKGVRVTTVDLDVPLVENGNRIAEATGWPLDNHAMDILDLPKSPLGEEQFDHVSSICVFEHIPLSSRLDAAHVLGEALRPGGTVSLTFDYRNPAPAAQIDSPAEVERQFIAGSGMQPRYNMPFHDNGKRYLVHPAEHPALSRGAGILHRLRTWGPKGLLRREPEPYTFGALFLERPETPTS